MSAPRATGWLVGAVAIVAAFVAGRCSVVVPTETAPATVASAPRAERPAARRPASTHAAGDDVVEKERAAAPKRPRAEVPPTTAETIAPAAVLEVLVVDGDGAPVEDAEVYALAADAAGTDDDEEAAAVETDEGGRARLPVLVAGSYDVGAVHEGLAVLAQDVRVPRDGAVELRFAECADVTVGVERPPAARANGRRAPVAFRVVWGAGASPETLWFLGRPPAGRRALRFPGRGEPSEQFADGTVGLGGPDHEARWEPRRVRIPQGAQAHVDVPAGWLADPREFTAPATVVLRPDTRPELHVRVLPEPAEFEPSNNTRLLVEFDAGPGSSPRPARFEWPVHAGMSLARAATGTVSIRVDGPGTLRWSGPGVVEGSCGHPGAAATADRPLEVTVRVEPSRLPGTRTVLRLLDPTAPDDGVQVVAAICSWSDDDREVGVGSGSSGEEEEAELGDAQWLYAVSESGGCAGPLRLPGGAEPVDVPFRLGGTLVLVPDGVAPRALGALTLRRKDGVPIPVRTNARSWEFPRAAEIVPGVVLGPLPPGEVVFEARLGPARLGDVVAHVAAGRATVVTIPVARR